LIRLERRRGRKLIRVQTVGHPPERRNEQIVNDNMMATIQFEAFSCLLIILCTSPSSASALLVSTRSSTRRYLADKLCRGRERESRVLDVAEVIACKQHGSNSSASRRERNTHMDVNKVMSNGWDTHTLSLSFGASSINGLSDLLVFTMQNFI
jgi:hypothetical protein